MNGGVILVNMPFSGVERPQIGISLLKAALRAQGVPCDVRYFNHVLADWVGPQLYQWLSEEVNHTVFAGEWVFAQQFFGGLLIDGEGYIRHIREALAVDAKTIRKILWLRRFIGPFLDYCLQSVDWSRYAVVGFTSTFEQNLASLALAQAIKERYPNLITVMGGANCEDPMGLALHRCFPFLDYVFSGEADHSFPDFVKRLINHEPVTDVRGLVYRKGRESIFTGPTEPVTDMDALPFPDYDDYFAQLEGTSIPRHTSSMVQIETSRGCWWGAKHHCTFCGLNALSMAFRAKSKERALEEILHLASRYPIKQIAAVDNIMDVQYFRDLLPELKRRKLDLHLFYEVKANMTKEQVKLLGEAGVKLIQPGIESLHAKMLSLMRKGVSPLQNVQLLKWCKQFGVRPSWNLLYGFPGERAQDYREMLPLIQSLMHLQPPDGQGSIRLDRFSPYFNNPESFGLINARPMSVYRYLYPIPESDLSDIAYFYEYDFADGLDPESYIGPTLRQLEIWREAASRGANLQSYSAAEGTLVIEDTRPNAVRRRMVLRNWQKDLYNFCDQARSLRAIERWLTEQQPRTSIREARGLLDQLVDLRMMARDGEQYLALAIPAPLAERGDTFFHYGTQVTHAAAATV